MSACPDWLKPSLNSTRLRRVAHTLADQIMADQVHTPIQTIAVRGASGMVVGGCVSMLCDIPLAIVRREKSSHSSNEVEYEDGPGFVYYIFLDDFISTGETLSKVMTAMGQTRKLSGIYLYKEQKSSLAACAPTALYRLDDTPKEGLEFLELVPFRHWNL